mgnify:FL=1
MSEIQLYSLEDYNLVHFNGKALYRQECLAIKKDHLKEEDLIWHNNKNEIYRDKKPA